MSAIIDKDSLVRQLVIPAGIRFADLHIVQGADGTIDMNENVLRQIAEESGVTLEFLHQPDILVDLLCRWYFLGKHHGEPEDETMERLWREVNSEPLH